MNGNDEAKSELILGLPILYSANLALHFPSIHSKESFKEKTVGKIYE